MMTRNLVPSCIPEEDRILAIRMLANARRHANRPFVKKNGWTVITQEEAKFLPSSPSYDELADVEIYDFTHHRPVHLFAYPSVDCAFITNWTGRKLGDVTRKGREYRAPFGDLRRNIQVLSINGVRYYGTMYGTYCRLHATQGRRANI